MKNKVLILLSLTVGLVVNIHAQGITFSEFPSWKDALEAARTSHKFLFVDVYATWCAPCKQMDREVYSLQEVADAVNKNCVAIKVQMDSTGSDDKYIRNWYNDSKKLIEKYQITSLPTLLFFSSDGSLINKSIGYRNPDDVLSFIKESTDSSNSIPVLIAMQKEGKLPYSGYISLLSRLRLLNEDSIANLIGSSFINNYLEKLPDDSLLNSRYLNFYASNNNLIKSSMRIFKIILAKPAIVDTIMHNKAFSTAIISNTLNREEVNPVLYPNNKTAVLVSDWQLIEKRIAQKSNPVIAEKLTMEARLKYLADKKKWAEYCNLLIARVEKYGSFNNMWPGAEDDFNYNNLAWDLFQHSDDKLQLQQALEWSNKAIAINPIPNWMDTKANLLYKMGRKKEAIQLEEQTVENARQSKDGQLPEFENNVKKMKEDLPTWPLL